MDMQIDSEKVKNLRQKKLWSQEELAISAGLSLRTVQRMEKEGNAANETVKAIAGALETKVEELLARESPLPYRHTQIGWTILIIMLVLWSVLDSVMSSDEAGVTVAAILFLVCVVFSALTIRVDSEGVGWFFGPGLPRFKVTAGDIADCQRVRSKWWWGWGIRFHPWGSWLYNVSGFDAVEVSLKSGKRFRLGTDEPVYLEQAIKALIN